MNGEVDVTVPLSSYSYEFKAIISKLDPKKVLTTDGPNKILRDWRGLAYLLAIPSELSHGISEGQDKAIRVVDIWIQTNNETATLGTLLGYLEEMDRYDVHDDLIELAKRGKVIGPKPTNGNELARVNGYRDDNMIITHDDRRDGFPNYYHAYVLFAQEDWSFVRELLARMKALKFKLCTEYDIELGYGTQFAPVAQLISERCYRIILVYSPAFLSSPANGFYSDYAQAVGIESNKRNIIPIIYRECKLPHNLMYYHKLIYNESGEWMPYDFWQKLAQTLDKVQLPNTFGEVVSQVTDSFSSNFLNVPALPSTDTVQIRASDIEGSLGQSSDNVGKKKKRAITRVFNYFSGKLKG